MNKAKYKISCIVWYFGRDGRDGYALRSSAVTGWTAANCHGESLAYRYTLADGSSKLESEIFATPLIAISRLLNPLKKNYIFNDHTIESIAPTPEQIISYLTDPERYYYIRESFAGVDFSTNDVVFMRGKYFECCDFSNVVANQFLFGGDEKRATDFINCNFANSNIGILLLGAFDGSNFGNAVLYLQVKKSSFRGCNFEHARLYNTDVSSCDFTASNFKDCNAAGITSSGANYTDSVMDGIIFAEEGVTGNLFQSNFTRASIKNAGLLNCDFKHSILKDADMSNSFLKNCDFQYSKGITNDQLYEFANKDVDTYTFTGVDGEEITVP